MPYERNGNERWGCRCIPALHNSDMRALALTV